MADMSALRKQIFDLNKKRQDAINRVLHTKEKVILTSKDTDSAIKIIHLYGQRSLIENCNFRELKQAAALGSLPQYKNENAEKTARIGELIIALLTADAIAGTAVFTSTIGPVLVANGANAARQSICNSFF